MTRLDVISGFLGAGKTTFILRLIQALKNEKIAIIENEYGRVGIDGDIVRTAGMDVYELTNGCICCSLKNDLRHTLETILERQVDRVIFEPSGIFVLSELLDLFKDPGLRSRCALNAVVTVVDATNFFTHLDRYPGFIKDQIQGASVLIVSKSQLVDARVLREIEDHLCRLNPMVPVWSKPWDELSDHVLLGFLAGSHRKSLGRELARPQGEHEFEAFSIITGKQFTEEQLVCFLHQVLNGVYGGIVRGKGVVPSGQGGLSFNYVTGQYEVRQTSDCSGKISLIGRDMKVEELKKFFQ